MHQPGCLRHQFCWQRTMPCSHFCWLDAENKKIPLFCLYGSPWLDPISQGPLAMPGLTLQGRKPSSLPSLHCAASRKWDKTSWPSKVSPPLTSLSCCHLTGASRISRSWRWPCMCPPPPPPRRLSGPPGHESQQWWSWPQHRHHCHCHSCHHHCHGKCHP